MVVIFDFDGTLTTTDTTKFLFLSLLLYRPFSFQTVLDFLKCSKKDKFNLQMQKYKTTANLIDGCKSESLKKRQWLFKILSKVYFRKNVVRIMQESIAKGDTVIIATASPTFAVQEIFSKVKIIGTEFFCQNGIYQNKTIEKICYGEKKAEMVIDYVKQANLSDVESVYSDDNSDMPLFSLAKNAFMVTKDSKIKKIMPPNSSHLRN